MAKTRAYRFLVTVFIEGDEFPPIEEIAEHVATQVQDADNHDLAVNVRPIETQTFNTDIYTMPLTTNAN